MITDTHLGVRNSSVEWLDIMKEYFRDFFIPLLKREKKEGDFLVHLGDVFDSRHSLNLLVMNEGITIFEEISKIMPVVIILGNHDIYKKNSNDVNSVKVLKWIPNITVLEEPEVLKVAGKRLLMMPWRAGHVEELECIKANPADFMFCHTEMQGLKFNKSTTIETGLDFAEIKAFRKVFAGHIHFAQQKSNFRMLGCPYPMTRSDVNNEKGIWCFDIANEEEIYYPNTVSPKFVRMTFERVLELHEDEAKELFRNNFVDILVDPKWSLNFPFSTFSEDMKGFRRLDFVPRLSNVEDEDGMLLESEDVDMEKIDILELSEKIIYNTGHSDHIKEKLVSTIKQLYDRVQKAQEEKEDA
jgi:predicted phosphodiesterase